MLATVIARGFVLLCLVLVCVVFAMIISHSIEEKKRHKRIEAARNVAHPKSGLFNDDQIFTNVEECRNDFV